MLRKKQSGETTIMVTAVILLMLFFATLAFEYISFQIARSEVSSLAKEAASHAANFLPDPKRACAEALKAVNALSLGGFGTDSEVKVIVSASETNTSGATAPSKVEYVAKTDGSGQCTEFCEKSSPGNCSAKLNPPIYDLKVQISRDFLPLVNLINLNGSSPFTVTAQSSAQLTPTDVVLVIDNSNSVVSPLKTPSAALPLWAANAPFALWNDVPGRQNPNSGSAYSETDISPVTRAEMRVRQCYGSVYYDIKAAALKMLDLLSSSGSFRVAVVHTLNPSGEFSGASLKFDADSYARMYQAAAAKDKLLPEPKGGETFARAGYPESRCAALSSVFPLPAHPLEDALSVTVTDLSTLLDTNNNSDPLKKLNFSASAADHMLPRDALWIKNGGDFLESGEPNYLASFSLFQRAIERATELLQGAPERSDGQTVRNKVILVFTDGLERPGTDFDIQQEGSGRTFSYVQTVGLTAGGSSNPPTPVPAQALEENFCTAFKDSNQNTGRIKLGVLHYGSREIWQAQKDPTAFLENLPGHDAAVSNFNAFARECNSSWEPPSGPSTFLVETQSSVANDAHDEYVGVIVPRVARALFEPKLGFSSDTIKK